MVNCRRAAHSHLPFDCYAMKVSCPSQSMPPSPGWPEMQGVLPSEEETKIHAQISNLGVHQPQGRHGELSYMGSIGTQVRLGYRLTKT